MTILSFTINYAESCQQKSKKCQQSLQLTNDIAPSPNEFELTQKTYGIRQAPIANPYREQAACGNTLEIRKDINFGEGFQMRLYETLSCNLIPLIAVKLRQCAGNCGYYAD